MRCVWFFGVFSPPLASRCWEHRSTGITSETGKGQVNDRLNNTIPSTVLEMIPLLVLKTNYPNQLFTLQLCRWKMLEILLPSSPHPQNTHTHTLFHLFTVNHIFTKADFKRTVRFGTGTRPTLPSTASCGNLAFMFRDKSLAYLDPLLRTTEITWWFPEASCLQF